MKLPVRLAIVTRSLAQASAPRRGPLALVITLAACGQSSQDARTGGAPASSGPTLVTLDGSSTVFPISEAVAEEFQKAEQEHSRDRGYLRHRRRLSEILPRRNRHRRCLAADQRHRGRSLREVRRRVHRVAGRLRRHRDRGESRRTAWADKITVAELKTMWASGRAGQGHQVEPGAQGLAGSRDSPVRRRRRFGHLRLLHRSDQRQGQGQPRRLHLERRRQRAGAGHQQRRARARLPAVRLLRRATATS